MARILIENLAVSYGESRIIEALDLEIVAGSFFTLLGPSGCGKTTLLRTLAGFLPVEAGTIRFGNVDVTHLPAHKRDIGMVFQDYALFPDKTVFDNVAYGLRARRQPEDVIGRKVGEYLERVGLNGLGGRHPAALSGGQRQRVALARALVIQPQVLLMDEPLSNLDAKLRVQVRETIADLQREAGITTVFVTHDQEEALALSDRIGLMRQGKIAQNATPEEIYRWPASGYVADFVGAANVIPVVITGAAEADQPLHVTVAGSAISATARHGVGPGAAMLIARPEDITLSRDGEEQASLGGRVLRKQYLGSRTSYRVVPLQAGMAEGTAIAVDLHGPGHNAFQEGEAVRIHFNPVKTLVTPA